jgi:hypothetical protein
MKGHGITNEAQQQSRRSMVPGIRLRGTTVVLALALVLVSGLVEAPSAEAQTWTFSVLYSFGGGADGANP